MKLKAVPHSRFFRPALGAAIGVLSGLALWTTPWGEGWRDASYDNLLRFGARPVTNQVVLVLMDNVAYGQFGQVRTQRWSRALHAKLLNRLADDACPLVVFDVFFEEPGDAAEDKALADAMRRQRQLVLMAGQNDLNYQNVAGAQPLLPTEPFLSAARTNWGVAKVDTNRVVRKHWPFPSSGRYPSLPWTAAQLAGAELSEEWRERWLRYYGRTDLDAAWTKLSYGGAFTQATNYFQNKIVFIGSDPETPQVGDENDEFRTPFSQWPPYDSAGGVKILATEFLNLMNGDWLRRPAGWMEVLGLVTTGVLLGGGLCQLRLRWAFGVVAGTGLVVMLGAVYLDYFSHYWVPWLVVAGGQVPCALGWALVCRRSTFTRPAVVEDQTGLPQIPGYALIHPPIGKGGYGEVWLGRATAPAAQEWRAIKVVYAKSFGEARPFQREFEGVSKYWPTSVNHPALLNILLVGINKPAGFFYYVMELGDPETADWQSDPKSYQPRNLANEYRRRKRLPAAECARIGIELCDALSHLHSADLIHRDIKPSNVIFVKGRPKLADIGLVTGIRRADKDVSYGGTRGYIAPEGPGTPQADIFSMGMLLYVVSTGRDPVEDYPTLPTTLVESNHHEDFRALNEIILKACQMDFNHRYATAAEMRVALLNAQQGRSADSTTERA